MEMSKSDIQNITNKLLKTLASSHKHARINMMKKLGMIKYTLLVGIHSIL